MQLIYSRIIYGLRFRYDHHASFQNRNWIMNDKEKNFNANGYDLSALNLKGICWSGTQYHNLREQTNQFLQGLVEPLPAIEGQQIVDLFRNEFFTNSNHFDFNSLSEEQKTYISIINFTYTYLSTIVTTCSRWFKATNKIFSGDLRDWRRPQGDNDNFSVTIEEIDDEEGIDNDEGVVDENIEVVDDDNEEYEDNILDEDHFRIDSIPGLYTRPLFWHSTTPPLRKIFDHLSQIKHSFHFFLELFYNTFGSISHLHFDYITYNSIFESVSQNDYKLFCAIIYNWDDSLISHLSIMVELAYPTFYFIESQITEYDLALESYKNELSASDPQYTASPLTFIVSHYYIYIFRNILEKYLDDFDRILPYASFSFYKKNFVEVFFDWINKETEAISEFFRNHPDNALPDKNVTEIPSDSKDTSYNRGATNEEQGQQEQQESGSSDETGNPPEDKPKRHLSVGHDIEAIKKLATYLVKGFTNTRGSLPALVSSNDEKNITINKLIFLFTGNKDYSFDGQYNLTWNAERVYLKLLIKLLHNLNELATGSHAVDTNRADYISDEYIKCRLTGGVWPKVAEAFENIKSGATIRNADYKSSYKNTEAPINKKRLRDLKVIADLWLKCKNDIDF